MAKFFRTLGVLVVNALDTCNASRYEMYVSFLKQIKQLIEYSIDLIETSRPTTNVTTLTINSLLPDTETCNSSLSLFYVTQHLLQALRGFVAADIVMDSNSTPNVRPSNGKTMGFKMNFEFESSRMTASDLWKIVSEQNLSFEELNKNDSLKGKQRSC